MYRVKHGIVKFNDIYYHEGLEILRSDNYNMEKLKDSIQRNGWKANFGDMPYHGDICTFTQPFFLRKSVSDGTLRIPNGKHRYIALRELGIQELDAYIEYHDYKVKHSKEIIEKKVNNIKNELENNKKGMFQSFEFPYNIKLISRDKSFDIFSSTCWYSEYYIEKDILDIASNACYFAFEAKKNYANKVVAFDVDPYMVNLAKIFGDIMDLDVDIRICNFWDFDWQENAYDIVFGNQFIYHVANDKEFYRGAKPSSMIMKALDLMCASTRNNLVMFTFVNFKDPWYCDYSDGYRPGYLRLEEDLLERGFKEIRIYHTEGGKRTVVASKEPWKYIWPTCNDPKTLVYKSKHINYSELSKYTTISQDKLKTIYEVKK